MQPRAETALRRGFERQIAAMAACDVARDGEPETNPAGGDVARRVEPEERAKYRFALLRRDAGTVVVDHDVDAAAAGQRGQRDRSSVAPRHRDDLVEERLQVDLDRRFRALAAREIEIALDHLLHIGDVRFELVDGNTIT